MPADELATLIEAAAACPQPEPATCPRCAWDLELDLPSGWSFGDRLSLEIRSGWSPTTKDLCAAVVGRTIRAGELSPPATLRMPHDCIALPEAPPLVSLALGLVVLSVLSKRAAHSKTKRAGLAPT